MMELAETAKLTALVRERTFSTFMVDWKLLIGLLHEIGNKMD